MKTAPTITVTVWVRDYAKDSYSVWSYEYETNKNKMAASTDTNSISTGSVIDVTSNKGSPEIANLAELESSPKGAVPKYVVCPSSSLK